MPFDLTQEQRRAVEDRDGALLVSAAAGSGKTRVLVERLLDRISCGSDIDRFLVITYTKAAAAELRDRIAAELSRRLAERPDDRHLRRQAVLLYKANISTVHAFCAQLLRENAAALDLDPDFRLCDEGETLILMQQVLQRLLDSRYENITPEDGFARLVDTMSAGRDDSRLAQIVLDIFGRIQSHPEPETWLTEQERLWRLEGVTDAADTPWGAALLEDMRGKTRYALYQMEQALQLAQSDRALSVNYADSLCRSIAAANGLLVASGWDAVKALLPVPFPAAGHKPGADEGTAQRVKNLRSRAKKRLDKLSELFEDDSAALLNDLLGASPAVQALMALVRDFGREYAEAKRRRNVADFSDLEHMALRLLCGQDGTPTALARQWSDRFDEVMADEFQDTNQVQNAIFRALSGGGRTLFMVGDVKQSIYRFRLADPSIFLNCYRTFAPWEQAKKGEPRRLLLTQNFRSRPEVLAGVNDLFSDLMSTAMGEMEYTQEQRLVSGVPRQEDARYHVELNVVAVPESEQDGEEAEQEDKNFTEARAAALRIRQLLDGGMAVGEGSEMRALNASDVMLLLRSPGPVLHQYISALAEQNIPWTADVGEDFFASTEVNVALALLQIVDNPRQDVPLISVLRSPVFAFSADRLAELRAAAEGDFYTAVTAAAQRGEEDCAEFLRRLDRMRFGAGDRTCSRMVWHVFQSTNLLGLFSAMPGGKQRRAHLLTLYEIARDREQAGCGTLFDFLLYLRHLQQTGRKLPVNAQPGSGVRIMSIHRSKGLEAPVVLVCGLGRRFNRDDLQRPVLFHQTLGVGPKYFLPERGIELNTLARRAVSLTLEREMLAEELRLLYVAMTRAREKLILSMAISKPDRVLASLRDDAESPVPPQALAECPCVGQWVLLSALTRRSGAPLRELAGMDEAQTDYEPAWDVCVTYDALPVKGAERPLTEMPIDERTLPDKEELLRRFIWRYPHAGAVDVPSKITATQLKGRALDEEAAQQAGHVSSRQMQPLVRPQFVAEKLGLTSAQQGIALHLAMQFIDYGKTADEGQIRAEIDRLVAQEYLTPLQGQAVDPARLTAFFRSSLGQEMTAAQTHREFKFSLLTPAEEYCPQAAGERVLLQGVVDCWYDTPQGITVVDFKSDRVTHETVQRRAQEYSGQLIAYARALGELTGRPVCRRVLWFFALDAAVEIPGETR